MSIHLEAGGGGGLIQSNAFFLYTDSLKLGRILSGGGGGGLIICGSLWYKEKYNALHD